MKHSIKFILGIILFSACAPAVAATQQISPTANNSPANTSISTQTATSTPRPSPTPNYPIYINTPVLNLLALTLDNIAEIRPLQSLTKDGSPPIFKIAASGPRKPPWAFSADLSLMAFVEGHNFSIIGINGNGKPAQSILATGKESWSDGAFLKDNKFLVIGQGNLTIFDLESNSEIKKAELYCCLDKKIFVLPDGERALIPSRTGLDLYNLATLKRIQGYDAPGNSTMVWDVSADGKLLAAAGERNPSVFIFDVERPFVLHTLTIERFVAVNLKFFPDGKQIVLTDELGAYKLMQFWDTETGKKAREIQLTNEMLTVPADYPFRVASIAIHPSGKIFVLAISSNNPLLVFWETGADKPFLILNATSFGVPSFNYATKTDFMEFIDESRLLIIDKI